MGSWAQLNNVYFLPVTCILCLEDKDSAGRLIENLNPSSVVNAENVDLAILPKDLLGNQLDIDNILIMNLDITYLKFAWKLQKATCTLNIKWVGELVASVRKQTAAKLTAQGD